MSFSSETKNQRCESKGGKVQLSLNFIKKNKEDKKFHNTSEI